MSNQAVNPEIQQTYGKRINEVNFAPSTLTLADLCLFPGFLCVRIMAEEEISKGGIHIPESARGSTLFGIIAKMAPEDAGRPLKVGDCVICASASQFTVRLEGIDYVIFSMVPDQNRDVPGYWLRSSFDKKQDG